jgi:hypothetical protein
VRFVSKREREKRWKGFENRWKGFQSFSTEQTVYYVEVVTDVAPRRAEGAGFILRAFRTSGLIIRCPYVVGGRDASLDKFVTI